MQYVEFADALTLSLPRNMEVGRSLSALPLTHRLHGIHIDWLAQSSARAAPASAGETLASMTKVGIALR